MKRFYLLFLLILSTSVTDAQTRIEIDLEQWSGKSSSIPFTINEVNDIRLQPDYIGDLNFSKKKTTQVYFASNSAIMIQQFLDRQFSMEKEMDIKMEIVVMDIETVKIKGKELSAFIFACKFYNLKNPNSEALYSFNARNSIPKRKGLKLAITNYISRALTAAVSNFRKSYLKHPEWQKAQNNTPSITIIKNIHSSNFLKGDTIELDGNYQLKKEDFSAPVLEDEKGTASSHIVITYSLDSEDASNKIKLDIYPKAFFLRSKSWVNVDSVGDGWLSHQQLLFDLATHHAKLFKEAIENKEFSAGYYKTELNKLYNESTAAYFNEMDELQMETQFGENQKASAKWREKINSYLRK